MSILDDLELSVRASNVLRKMGVETQEHFMALTRRTVLAQKNAGVRTWYEVAEAQQGLREAQKQHRRRLSGGPAYPSENWPGMSMRDAAALAALQGLASSFTTLGVMGKEAERRGTEPADVLAASAWELADAFIAARDTKEAR